MESGALAPYERALLGGGRLGLRSVSGAVLALDVARWLAGADESDDTVLDRCTGPVLDVGCGPGRLVSALTERGTAALGVDIAETAVALTRRQGFPALLRSVFADLPGEGRWPTVLLIDGNIGIGGDPRQLLGRVRGLLGPGGRLIVETAPGPDVDERYDVRFTEDGRPVGPVFGWAELGRNPMTRYAAAAELIVEETWTAGERSFSAFRPAERFTTG